MVQTRSMLNAVQSNNSPSIIRTRSQKKKVYGESILQKLIDFYNVHNRVPRHSEDDLYETSLADLLDEFRKVSPYCFSPDYYSLLLEVYPWLETDGDVSDVLQLSDDSEYSLSSDSEQESEPESDPEPESIISRFHSPVTIVINNNDSVHNGRWICALSYMIAYLMILLITYTCLKYSMNKDIMPYLGDLL
jgi:hypothetical protein